MKTKTIRQTLSFHASARDVFEMLMDEKSMHILRGVWHRSTRPWEERFQPTTAVQPARIPSWFMTIKLCRHGERVTGLKGHYSTLTITLSPVSSKTLLSFVQTGVPSDQFEEISKGWYDYCWTPLKALLEKV
jgi:activator of HSP90 ATPase